MSVEVLYANQEQVKAVAKIAQSDMRRARKEGSLMIAQTKFGTVTLTYDAASRSYTCVTNEIEPKTLFRGFMASGCELRLCGAIYQIEIEK